VSVLLDVLVLPTLLSSVAAYTLLGILILFQVITIYCFFLIYLKDPGILPKNPEDPIPEIRVNQSRFEETVLDGHYIKTKFCTTCHIYRPPRGFHCDTCGCCIERFDHHCPWLSTCIGRKNYRSFILFLGVLGGLFMATIAVTIVAMATRLVDKQNQGYPGWSGVNQMLRDQGYWALIVCILASVAAFFVLALLVYHLYLRYKGRTTYEHMKGHDFDVYDHGCVANYKEFFCPG
jgi:palmitoyltransferase ZDHHC9/14/18